jgi:hypothetical protein
VRRVAAGRCTTRGEAQPIYTPCDTIGNDVTCTWGYAIHSSRVSEASGAAMASSSTRRSAVWAAAAAADRYKLRYLRMAALT